MIKLSQHIGVDCFVLLFFLLLLVLFHLFGNAGRSKTAEYESNKKINCKGNSVDS